MDHDYEKLLVGDSFRYAMGAKDTATAVENWRASRSPVARRLDSVDLMLTLPEMWREPTWLYRYFDAEDLLYVGIASDVQARDFAHYRRSSWRRHAVRMTAELFPSRTLATDAENKAIHEEQPLANVKRLPYSGGDWGIDAWFVERQVGLVGCRKVELTPDGPNLRLAPEREE